MRKRKNKKFSFKKTLRLLIPLTIIVITLINLEKIKVYYYSKITGYNEETIEVFIDKGIYNNIKTEKYSKVLESIINTDKYQEKYLKDYINIKYREEENYLDNINSLLNIGYDYKIINEIYDKLESSTIEKIISLEYINDLENIINISYFKETNLERYVKYIENKKQDIETSLTYVNIGLDNKFYTNTEAISKQEELDVLVNKYYYLSDTYIPSDLTTISSKYQWLGRSNQLRSEAAKAFEEMCEGAKKDNIYIYAGSGYRSYQTQKYLYNNYIARDGFESAETYSARPGYSEHQTGLAMDIANSYDFISENDKEYTWLINNSYKYGYILRYPKDKDSITGYMYEEWHYRYVGKELAKEVYESKLTYEEYLARK